uniref:tRNA pseudouridine(55) synthase n=1 Tax=Lygus hesperus TaxID=30085 RepID=A0A0A9Y774_LYGHE
MVLGRWKLWGNGAGDAERTSAQQQQQLEHVPQNPNSQFSVFLHFITPPIVNEWNLRRELETKMNKFQKQRSSRCETPDSLSVNSNLYKVLARTSYTALRNLQLVPPKVPQHQLLSSTESTAAPTVGQRTADIQSVARINGLDPGTVVYISPYTAVEICCQHESIFLCASYRKLSRYCSHSLWSASGHSNQQGETDTGKSALTVNPTTSVEEEVAKYVTKYFQPYSDSESSRTTSHTYTFKFHSSGREDLDVRMLGNGRPMFLEMCNPHRVPVSLDYTSICETINSMSSAVQV